MSRTPIGAQLLQLALRRMAQTGDQLDHGTKRIFHELGMNVPESTRGKQFSAAVRELEQKLEGEGGIDRFFDAFRRPPPAPPPRAITTTIVKKK